MISATAAVFVGAALVTGRPYVPGEIPAASWPFLGAIGFLGTFLAIQTFYAGSRRIGAAQAALVSTVEPLIMVERMQDHALFHGSALRAAGRGQQLGSGCQHRALLARAQHQLWGNAVDHDQRFFTTK